MSEQARTGQGWVAQARVGQARVLQAWMGQARVLQAWTGQAWMGREPIGQWTGQAQGLPLQEWRRPSPS